MAGAAQLQASFQCAVIAPLSKLLKHSKQYLSYYWGLELWVRQCDEYGGRWVQLHLSGFDAQNVVKTIDDTRLQKLLSKAGLRPPCQRAAQ